MQITEKIKIEINTTSSLGGEFYHVYINDEEWKMCDGYNDLVRTMGYIIKSKFKEKEG